MGVQWIWFALFLLYFVVFESWWGLTRYKKIMKSIIEGKTPKTELYKRLMIGLWIPAGMILALILTEDYTMEDMGLCWIKPSNITWLFYISLVLGLLYFVYLAYSIVALKINAIKKVNISQQIPDEIKVMLPITKKEKRVWFATAITAGFTEELIFRGFFFSLMGQLFPGMNLFLILGVSTLIFGIGHLYQGIMEAVKPMILGLVFGIFTIAFGSILPTILLHAKQDLCATYLVNE